MVRCVAGHRGSFSRPNGREIAIKSGDVGDAALAIRGDLSVLSVASGGGGGRFGHVRELMERLNLAAGGMITIVLGDLIRSCISEEL